MIPLVVTDPSNKKDEELNIHFMFSKVACESETQLFNRPETHEEPEEILRCTRTHYYRKTMSFLLEKRSHIKIGTQIYKTNVNVLGNLHWKIDD